MTCSDEKVSVIVEVERTLNSRPLTYLSADDLDEPLTPAHLLTGRRLHGSDTHVSSELDLDFVASSTHSDVTSRMKHLQLILQHFRKRWKNEYLVHLREAHRFSTNKTKERFGDWEGWSSSSRAVMIIYTVLYYLGCTVLRQWTCTNG
eukprot:Em0012g163a